MVLLTVFLLWRSLQQASFIRPAAGYEDPSENIAQENRTRDRYHLLSLAEGRRYV